MAGKIFIIDEWLLHDLSGDNGNEKRAEAENFLVKMVAICDRIAILLGGIWADKAYQLYSRSDVDTRRLSKLLFSQVITKPLKCDPFRPEELAVVPDEILHRVPEPDRYLLKLYFHTRADALITTDERHFGSLEIPSLNVRNRDDFLSAYGEPDP